MGWYSVAEALKSGDADLLAAEMARENDPDRSLMVAKSELQRQGLAVRCALCNRPIYLKQRFQKHLLPEELGAFAEEHDGMLGYVCLDGNC